MTTGGRTGCAAGVLAAALLAGCTGAAAPTVPTGSTSTGPSGTGAPPSTPGTSTPGTSTTPPPTASAAPTAAAAPDPASIPALIAASYDGRDLRLGREGGSTSAYRQYFATYRGDGLTISGRINVPRGRGPFPAVVLAHGYVDPAEYTNGETMLRERDRLARAGYVTLHIDYRNHAQSSRDPDNDAALRAGYTVDAVNAGLALKASPLVDPDRVAIIGRSMGGGVVYNALVAKPGLFRAAVAYSPVSSDTVDNFNRWFRRDASRSAAARAVLARLGTPEAQPARWARTSPRTYFDRVADPLLVLHGTADEDCPIAWSAETVAALRAKGKTVEYVVYPGQRHTFTTRWPDSIARVEAFLGRHLT